MVITPLGSSRGNRANCGVIDEYRDHSPDDIAEIILPRINRGLTIVILYEKDGEPMTKGCVIYK